jgi:oligopeptide/dipeptide ABC transporter ATP-binding protein
MTNREREAAAIKLLKEAGIPSPDERMRQYPHELSGGMRQRVLIAMALACKPQLLIADEPTTALDVTIQAQILALIRGLQESHNMTVVLITHDMGVVATLCKRAAVMYAGLILEIANIEELFESPLHPYTKALLRSIPSLNDTAGDTAAGKRLLTISGQPPSMANVPSGCPFAPRCQHAVAKCSQSLPEIREVSTGHSVRCPLPWGAYPFGVGNGGGF